MKNKHFLVIVQWILALCICAGVAVGLHHLFALHNDSHFSYHPDEGGKSQQILLGVRNYNHPLLMLEATQWRFDRAPRRDFQYIVLLGRDTTAWFGAIGGALFALAGYVVARWRGLALLGIAAGLCPALLAHSKYFKEDTYLVFGVAVLVFAAAVCCRARHARWAILPVLATTLLGLGCGLAASAKYSGALFAAPAAILGLICVIRRRSWWWTIVLSLVLMSAAAVGSWSWINQRAFTEWEYFKNNYNDEKTHGTTAHYDTTMDQPNGYFVDAVWKDLMPHARVLLAAGVVVVVMTAFQSIRRRRAVMPDPHNPQSDDRPPSARVTELLFGHWLFWTAIFYLVCISYSVIPFYRYALPVSVLLYASAGMAVVWISQSMPRRWMSIGTFIFGAAILFWLQAARCAEYNWQFAHDSRNEVQEWVRDNTSSRDRIFADWYTLLQEPGNLARMLTRDRRAQVHLMQVGQFPPQAQALPRMGFTYVVIAGTNFERYFSPYTHPSQYAGNAFLARQKFYRELFDRYPIVWQRKAEHPMNVFANPDIFVFKVSPDGKR